MIRESAWEFICPEKRIQFKHRVIEFESRWIISKDKCISWIDSCTPKKGSWMLESDWQFDRNQKEFRERNWSSEEGIQISKIVVYLRNSFLFSCNCNSKGASRNLDSFNQEAQCDIWIVPNVRSSFIVAIAFLI